MHCTSSLPSTGELMRMTRPMGEEDRIPRRRCSFFRKRLRVAVCDPWVPGVFSLRDGSDEWAMEAGRVPFHTHTPPGAQLRVEESTAAYSRRKGILRQFVLCVPCILKLYYAQVWIKRSSQLHRKHKHMHCDYLYNAVSSLLVEWNGRIIQLTDAGCFVTW